MVIIKDGSPNLVREKIKERIYLSDRICTTENDGMPIFCYFQK